MNSAPSKMSGRVQIAILSFLQLGFELLYIKLGLYQFATLSAGFASLALLGVALASPAAGLFRDSRAAARWSLVALPLSALLSGVVLFAQTHLPTTESAAWMSTVVCGIPALLTMLLASVPIYARLRREPERTGGLYRASLLGAALGAACLFPIMELGGDVLAFAVLVALCGVAFVVSDEDPAPRAAGAAACVLMGALAFILIPRLDRAAHRRSTYIETDAVSRIDVTRDPRREGLIGIRTAGINAGTDAMDLPVRSGRPPRHRDAIAVVPLALAPRKVLILGAGGGTQVIDALEFGASEVVAVEINKMIPRWMDAHMRPSHNPYRDPATRLIIGEGREIAARLARDGERFDLVFVPITTRFGSAGYLFTHTYLMTREALTQYLAMTRADGIAAVFFSDDGKVRQKVLRGMKDALEALGVRDPAGHLACLANERNFLIVASRDSGVIARMLERMSPTARARPLDLERELEAARGLKRLTDDNPYLYNDAEQTRAGFHLVYEWNPRLTDLIFLAVALLSAALWAAGARRAPEGRRRRAGRLAAFLLTGAAYSIFQIAWLQRLGFLLGHPTLASALGLPAALLLTAAGSRELTRRARLGAAALIAVSCLALAWLPPSALILNGWPAFARVAAALLLALPFAAMGGFFPRLLQSAAADAPDAVAWGWCLNGAGAVLGFMACIAGSMRWGFAPLFILVAVLYAVVSAYLDVAVNTPSQ